MNVRGQRTHGNGQDSLSPLWERRTGAQWTGFQRKAEIPLPCIKDGKAGKIPHRMSIQKNVEKSNIQREERKQEKRLMWSAGITRCDNVWLVLFARLSISQNLYSYMMLV